MKIYEQVYGGLHACLELLRTHGGLPPGGMRIPPPLFRWPNIGCYPINIRGLQSECMGECTCNLGRRSAPREGVCSSSR